jgi:hypothetical protein
MKVSHEGNILPPDNISQLIGGNNIGCTVFMVISVIFLLVIIFGVVAQCFYFEKCLKCLSKKCPTFTDI